MITLILAAAAFAGPAKLVWGVSDQPLVIDYPSSARCEEARKIIDADIKARYQIAQSRLEPGAVLTKVALTGPTVCIPA